MISAKTKAHTGCRQVVDSQYTNKEICLEKGYHVGGPQLCRSTSISALTIRSKPYVPILRIPKTNMETKITRYHLHHMISS